MNRIRPSTHCLVCGIDLLKRWISIRMLRATADLAWMTNSGICDHCSRARQSAAVEFLRAADEVRTWMHLGAAWEGRGKPNQALGAAFRRLQSAERRCVQLKMWPAKRSTRRPTRFYGDERSTTR